MVAAQIQRTFDATELNRVVNHPSIYPWVRGTSVGALDLTPLVENTSNVLLQGEHGSIFFQMLQGGLYEAHTQVLPNGRGKWAAEMVRSALHWMFSRTDCVEVVTKCPYRAAKALAVSVGLKFEFTARLGWVRNGVPCPCDVYAIRIQDWMRDASGLVERGRWFHDRLTEEYARLGKTETLHKDDTNHDRYVGAAVEMALGDQADKAVIFYNRWAALAGYQQIWIASRQPLVINISEALIGVGNDSVRVFSCQ